MRQIFQRRGGKMNTCDTEKVSNFNFFQENFSTLSMYKKYNNFNMFCMKWNIMWCLVRHMLLPVLVLLVRCVLLYITKLNYIMDKMLHTGTHIKPAQNKMFVIFNIVALKCLVRKLVPRQLAVTRRPFKLSILLTSWKTEGDVTHPSFPANIYVEIRHVQTKMLGSFSIFY